MIVFLQVLMLYNVNNLCVKEWDLNKLLSIYLFVHWFSPRDARLLVRGILDLQIPDLERYGRLNMEEVTDGQVVRAGVSVTWNVLSWSGGYEFEPRSGQTWGAWYFRSKLYLNQNIDRCRS